MMRELGIRKKPYTQREQYQRSGTPVSELENLSWAEEKDRQFSVAAPPRRRTLARRH